MKMTRLNDNFNWYNLQVDEQNNSPASYFAETLGILLETLKR